MVSTMRENSLTLVPYQVLTLPTYSLASILVYQYISSPPSTTILIVVSPCMYKTRSPGSTMATMNGP